MLEQLRSYASAASDDGMIHRCHETHQEAATQILARSHAPAR
jgi:hypothetical protein